MGTDTRRRSARFTLGRLARARMDNDVFRWEAAEVLRRAVGFDTWCCVLLDPAFTTGDTSPPPSPANPARRQHKPHHDAPGASPTTPLE